MVLQCLATKTQWTRCMNKVPRNNYTKPSNLKLMAVHDIAYVLIMIMNHASICILSMTLYYFYVVLLIISDSVIFIVACNDINNFTIKVTHMILIYNTKV